MEPVTHILTGACLARAGFNRRAAYATLTMALAAEFPDIDTFWSLRGPVEGFQHHRGVTHTFIGVPFEALVVVGAVWLLHRWRLHRAARHAALESAESAATATPLRPQRLLTAAPARWGLLYLFALLALLSHLLLDYTNNYGLRPFFPFNDHWYAGSIVFIFDPVIFLLLLAALVMPALIRLVNAEIGARAEIFRGRRWAIAALIGIVLLWTLRAFEHQRALQLANQQMVEAPTSAAAEDSPASVQPGTGPALSPPAVFLQPQRVLASPDIINPFRWHTAIDFGPEIQLAEVESSSGVVTPATGFFAKSPRTAELIAAQASPLGRAYMDWSAMPVLDVSNATEPGEPTVVIFRDARFLGGFSVFGDRIPLTGIVELDVYRHVTSQSMDGHLE
jgi:inner membrane protein